MKSQHCDEEKEVVDTNTVMRKGLRLRKNFRNIENSSGISKLGTDPASTPKRPICQAKLGDVETFISSYNTLCEQVETLREEKYDSHNPAHKENFLNCGVCLDRMIRSLRVSGDIGELLDSRVMTHPGIFVEWVFSRWNS
ncbi:hypothetical protein KIN20_029120 [Parelaphostrongylus tenuis]|uniref:Uncharacterized protein n=1 Tax=Parelaphostrongylus tenuis TaxID=148309 RepID=A0AAD5WFC3_PARTN|nr:hypothetical protein KIN20_029120 [Parelaphostrongylus tenuis]